MYSMCVIYVLKGENITYTGRNTQNSFEELTKIFIN